ncbi:DUF7289 family protein [Haloarcula pelagica]|uniref:DUF7289 family protein n=1 Tax=Haloarcula pelagica TaxID=3033389 RepID=UPI0024C41CCD|nr:hypothetical protein [Halomicroarcula sp. YJ-61-S]
MNGHSLCDDGRGQSAVIGFVLMFGLLILLMSVLQVSAVPAWNQGEEFAHSQQVRSELELLRDDVTTAAATGRVTSESVTLGLRYPRRPFLLNPADPAGRLNTTTPGAVELENLTASGETGDYWAGGTQRFETRHLVYRPQYNEYDNAPTTVLENSVLYDRYGERARPLTSERVVAGRRITLVMLNGSLSRSATTATDIELTPVSAPEQVTSVEGDGPVRLRLPTRLDREAWNELLRDEFVRNGATSTTTSRSHRGRRTIRSRSHSNATRRTICGWRESTSASSRLRPRLTTSLPTRAGWRPCRVAAHSGSSSRSGTGSTTLSAVSG